MIKKFLIAGLILIVFAGCQKDECGYNECEFKAAASEIQAVQNYLASQSIANAKQHCSGLFYVIDTLGTGKYPNACSYISVRYKGFLTSGAIFDEGGASFSLGGTILGWRNGLPLIKQGGKIRLFVPPGLGYGGQAQGTTIPANSILVFEVNLDAVQ